MGKIKKRWAGETKYSITSFPDIIFRGRNPFAIKDAKHRTALLGTGVFSIVDDTSMRYSGKVEIPCADGSKCEIGEDGIAEYDPDSLTDRLKGLIEKEMENL